MLGKLFCFFGFHSYTDKICDDISGFKYISGFKCSRCDSIEIFKVQY